MGYNSFDFDSFGSLVQSLGEGYVLVDRLTLEDYVGSISLHIIERVRFLPPLHFHVG